MFGFLNDFGNYEDRKVARDDAEGGLSISTARVSDGAKPFETAVSHPDYNNDKWVIVENYDTKEEAQAGHEKWKKIMTADPLPESLKDCSNSDVSRLVDALGGGMVFPRQVK